MSHYKEHGDPDFPSAAELELHVFECDASECRDTFEKDGTFSEAWNEAKSYGWRARQDPSGSWSHFCPLHAG